MEIQLKKEDLKASDYLQKIVENTESLKLLLLSATPMFNEPNDIVPP